MGTETARAQQLGLHNDGMNEVMSFLDRNSRATSVCLSGGAVATLLRLGAPDNDVTLLGVSLEVKAGFHAARQVDQPQ